MSNFYYFFCFEVDVPDDHLMPVGLPNMWSVFKIIDRVSGDPVSGPDSQVLLGIPIQKKKGKINPKVVKMK